MKLDPNALDFPEQKSYNIHICVQKRQNFQHKTMNNKMPR